MTEATATEKINSYFAKKLEQSLESMNNGQRESFLKEGLESLSFISQSFDQEIGLISADGAKMGVILFNSPYYDTGYEKIHKNAKHNFLDLNLLEELFKANGFQVSYNVEGFMNVEWIRNQRHVQFELRADTLKALLEVTPKSNMRFYLNAVHFNAGKRWLEATDGLIALRIPIPYELPDGLPDLIIPRGAIESMVAAAKTAKIPVINVRELVKDHYQFHIGDERGAFTGLDAEYPDFDRAFSPSQADADILPFHIDAKLLNKWFKVQKILFKNACLHNGSESPIKCHVGYVFKRNDVQCLIATLKQKSN